MRSIAYPGWDIVRLIGSGSYGTVYEIQRNLFGNVEKAALKVIHIPQSQSDIEELYNDGFDEDFGSPDEGLHDRRNEPGRSNGGFDDGFDDDFGKNGVDDYFNW